MEQSAPQVPLPPLPLAPGNRIGILEGLRGVLAFWVMISHLLMFLGFMTTMPHGTPQWVRACLPVVIDSHTPVRIFMIMSGFVIFLLIDTRRERYRNFIARRFIRLFPAFACALLIGVLVSPLQAGLSALPWGRVGWLAHQADLARVHQDHFVANVVAHLTLLYGLIPKPYLPDATGAFLGAAWSISAEWQFYLVAPGAFALARGTVGLAALGIGAIVLPKVLPIESFVNESTALLIPHFWLFFIGGCSYGAYRWFCDGLAAGAAPPRGLVVGALAVAWFVPDPTFAIWLVILCSICQVVAAPKGLEARAVQAAGCNPVIAFLGRISYSIYLVHWPVAIGVLAIGKRHLAINWATFIGAYMASSMLLTVVLAALLYHAVEAPAIRWGNRKFGGRPPKVHSS